MRYIIFGAGNNAAKLIERLISNEFELEYVVDNEEGKWGSQISGFLVKSVDVLSSINKCEYHILISVLDKQLYLQISNQLISMGFLEGSDFSNGLQLFNIFEMKSGKVSGYVELPKGFTSIKTFDAASYLIKHKVQGRIFRFVNEEYKERYLETYHLCASHGLLGSCIIDTTIAEEKWGFPNGLLFEHRYIEPVSYCFEWAPDMFYEYVRFMINMLHSLTESGLALSDGHALNATISDGKFIFLDFGAIQPGITKSSVLIEFINTHMIPLILMFRNQIPKAYLYLKNPGIEYTITDVQGYLTDIELSEIHELYASLAQIADAQSITNFVAKALKLVDIIKRKKHQTRWEGYQNDEWEWSEDTTKWSTKMHGVIKMIKCVQPSTVVDLAGNMGWYGTYLHKNFKYAVIADYDYNCLDYLWKKIKSYKIPNVIPAYMSVCSPTLSYYRDEGIGTTAIIPWRKSAIERYKADLVIALAVVHHLAFAQQLTFREIIDQFTLFSNRYLIVEFVEQSDQYITDFLKDGFDWYTKENFVTELEKNLNIIETHLSTPEETRVLYLCELK